MADPNNPNYDGQGRTAWEDGQSSARGLGVAIIASLLITLAIVLVIVL